MKKSEILKNKIPWPIISVLLALIFGGFGIYAVVHEKNPNISYEIINEVNVLDVRKPLKDLKISFQEKDTQKENMNLRIFTVRIENNGEVDILQDQYDVGDIWGIQVQDARIIEVRLIQSNSDYLKSKLKPDLIEDDKIKLNKVIFEKGKFFVLEILVLHEKNLKPEIISVGKIAGIEKNVPIKSWEEKEESFLEELFYGSAFIHFIRFIIYLLSLIIAGFIIGLSVSKFSDLKHERKRKLRRKEVINMFGAPALAEDTEEKLLYENYIDYGIEGIKNLNELLKDENRLVLEIKRFELAKKLIEAKGGKKAVSELYVPSEREHRDYSYLLASPITELVRKGILTIRANNKIIIKKEYKRALDEFLKYLEVANKK